MLFASNCSCILRDDFVSCKYARSIHAYVRINSSIYDSTVQNLFLFYTPLSIAKGETLFKITYVFRSNAVLRTDFGKQPQISLRT